MLLVCVWRKVVCKGEGRESNLSIAEPLTTGVQVLERHWTRGQVSQGRSGSYSNWEALDKISSPYWHLVS